MIPDLQGIFSITCCFTEANPVEHGTERSDAKFDVANIKQVFKGNFHPQILILWSVYRFGWAGQIAWCTNSPLTLMLVFYLWCPTMPIMPFNTSKEYVWTCWILAHDSNALWSTEATFSGTLDFYDWFLPVWLQVGAKFRAYKDVSEVERLTVAEFAADVLYSWNISCHQTIMRRGGTLKLRTSIIILKSVGETRVINETIKACFKLSQPGSNIWCAEEMNYTTNH